MPVSSPSAVMTIGKIKGVIVSRMPTIITPLIMLPNRANCQRQRARELADDVERQHDDRRLRVGLEVAAQPLLPMPKSGTATKTHSASAAVVESEPVGGLKPGITVQRLAVATNRKSVPRKGRYFPGLIETHILDLLLHAVTMISSAPCQREIVPPVASLRVMSFEPTVIADHHDPGRDDGFVEFHEAVLPQNLLVGGEIHGSGPFLLRALSTSASGNRAREPRHEDPRGKTQAGKPATSANRRARRNRNRQRDRRSAAAGCRTQSPGCLDETPLRIVHQRPPKKIAPSKTTPAKHSRSSSEFSTCSIQHGFTHRCPSPSAGSSCMALSSCATQCQAFAQPMTRPAISSISVQECAPGWRRSSQIPSIAPAVGTATDQPISPGHAQAEPDALLPSRCALSLRAAFAATCAENSPLRRRLPRPMGAVPRLIAFHSPIMLKLREAADKPPSIFRACRERALRFIELEKLAFHRIVQLAQIGPADGAAHRHEHIRPALTSTPSSTAT
jgi:hypothetical protein